MAEPTVDELLAQRDALVDTRTRTLTSGAVTNVRDAYGRSFTSQPSSVADLDRAIAQIELRISRLTQVSVRRPIYIAY